MLGEKAYTFGEWMFWLYVYHAGMICFRHLDDEYETLFEASYTKRRALLSCIQFLFSETQLQRLLQILIIRISCRGGTCLAFVSML
jgi:hypothetical protein